VFNARKNTNSTQENQSSSNIFRRKDLAMKVIVIQNFEIVQKLDSNNLTDAAIIAFNKAISENPIISSYKVVFHKPQKINCTNIHSFLDSLQLAQENIKRIVLDLG
jgi:hypothetical protein